MWLTELCIKRPVLTLMFYATVLVLGLRSLSDMPVELFPNVEIPVISIQTIFKGADPETVEEQVTKPLEDSVSTVSGIDELESVSQENVSTLIVTFEVGTDLDVKANDIRERVESVKSQLPREAEAPAVFKLSFSSEPILFYGVRGKMPIEDLRKLVEDEIADPLSQINGIGQVLVSGGRKKEVRVVADVDRLAGSQLTLHDITAAIQRNNLDLPSGKLEGQTREYKVATKGKFQSVLELASLPISLRNMHASLPLSDFAQVNFSFEDQDEITRINGKEGVGISLLKTSKANTVRVVSAVENRIEEILPTLPPGVTVQRIADNSKRIKEALSDVQQTIVLGILLAVFIVYLFLYSLRGTIIVALAIPLSVLFAFIPMRFMGIGINQMSMLGLALSVGSLVDDAIVVIENIFRHLQRGETPEVAALQGRGEIGAAAVAITLTSIAVFLPVAFMGGIVGQFFKDFGMTSFFAVLASLLISFTLTPALTALFFRKGEDLVPKRGFFSLFDRFFEKSSSVYASALRKVLAHRAAAIFWSFALLIFVGKTLGPKLKGQFLPPVDQGRVGITIKMPQGTALSATQKKIEAIEARLHRIPQIVSIFTTVGSTQGGFEGVGEKGARFGQLVLTLKPRATILDKFFLRASGMRQVSDEIMAERIHRAINDIPAGDVRVVPIRGAGGGFGAPIEIFLLGKDLNQLFRQAQQIKELVSQVPGTTSVQVGFEKGEPQWSFHPDRIRLNDLGLTFTEAGDILRTAIEGSVVSTYEEGGDEYDVRLIGKGYKRGDINQLLALPLRPTASGLLRLGQVGHFALETTSSRIERREKQRAITVSSYLKPGATEEQVQAAIAGRLKKLPLFGTKIQWGGDTKRRRQNMVYLVGALQLAITLTYIIMAMLYNNILYPFIIMFTLPMAFIGVIIALVWSSTPMSLVSMIGVIMLVGIVPNSGILLVDYTNTLRARGERKLDAVVESGRTRLRPILMTALTLIISLIPTVLHIGPGADFRAPMATAVLGGMLVATVLTLFLIPCLYLAIDNSWEWLWKKMKRS